MPLQAMRNLALQALLAAALAGSAAGGVAVCGDATGDGAVTVTDGVQALRAAAGLSTTCDDGCDVDGNGTITVSDGVNILRKAAGIPVVDACDFTGAEANGVVSPALPVFGALTKVPGVSSQASLAAGTCDNDGTITTVGAGSSSIITFSDCRLGNAIVDGTIGRVVLGSGLALGLDALKLRRVRGGETLTLNGTLGVGDMQGAAKLIDGTLEADSPQRGAFTIAFEHIVLAGDGAARQGSLIFDLPATAAGSIARIQIDFANAERPPAIVTLRTQRIVRFLLDRNTGLLHRAA